MYRKQLYMLLFANECYVWAIYPLVFFCWKNNFQRTELVCVSVLRLEDTPVCSKVHVENARSSYRDAFVVVVVVGGTARW